jgi:hypothetical protein
MNEHEFARHQCVRWSVMLCLVWFLNMLYHDTHVLHLTMIEICYRKPSCWMFMGGVVAQSK